MTAPHAPLYCPTCRKILDPAGWMFHMLAHADPHGDEPACLARHVSGLHCFRRRNHMEQKHRSLLGTIEWL